jgi:hypothetical protein
MDGVRAHAQGTMQNPVGGAEAKQERMVMYIDLGQGAECDPAAFPPREFVCPGRSPTASRPPPE